MIVTVFTSIVGAIRPHPPTPTLAGSGAACPSVPNTAPWPCTASMSQPCDTVSSEDSNIIYDRVSGPFCLLDSDPARVRRPFCSSHSVYLTNHILRTVHFTTKPVLLVYSADSKGK